MAVAGLTLEARPSAVRPYNNITMRWIKPSIRSSIYGLLGGHTAPTESTLENGTEDIRQAMLDMLGDTGPRQFPQLTRRVRYASDVQALWYLRGELMAALASMHGEAGARDRVARLNAMFRGLLPPGLTSRPGPLAG